jgi:trk system potassium uptake protein
MISKFTNKSAQKGPIFPSKAKYARGLMIYKNICKILGLYFFAFTTALGIPLALAVYYQFVVPETHPQPHTTPAFLLSIALTLILAAILYFFGRNAGGRIYRREGLAAVVFIWLLTPLVSALPFWLSGTLTNPVAAYFEAASGLTTTGSTSMHPKKFDPLTGKEIPIVEVVRGEIDTVYTFYGTIEPVREVGTNKILYEGIEAVSKALLFWRAFIQWIGGLGIVVIFVAILPMLGVGGKVLYHTEVPGPIKEALTPRIKETAIQLWKIYVGLTVVQIILLMATNSKMEALDAITTAFTTLSTGGFSIRNSSIAYYESATTEWIIVLFMLLGSINFSLYYYVIRGKIYRIYEPEFILFIIIVVVACALASWQLIGSYKHPLISEADTLLTTHEAIRYGSFQVISAMTTTGFSVANYDRWPYVVQTILLIVMFVGGMSGSTAGGIKIMRHYILYRIAYFKTESLFRPKEVQIFKVGDKEVDNNALVMVLAFFLVTISVSVAGTFLYILDGVDPDTSLGLVGCMINCTGLTFRVGGPLDSCAFLSNFGYFLSSALMILGRLEFFAIFAVLTRSFWKQNCS